MKNKFSLENYFFIIVNITIVTFLISKKVTTFPDSGSYIKNLILRTPSYPLLLDFFEFLFGPSYLLSVAHFQIIISFITVFILSLTLKKYFNLGKIAFLLIYFILLSPIYSPFNYINQHIANNIGTESVSYSLFLITIYFMIKFIFESKLKYLIYFLFISVLTITVRPQFLFLYIVGIVLLLYPVYRKNFSQTIIAGFSLGFFILGAMLYERTYNYIYHDYFTTVPVTGVQLITQPLYLLNFSGKNILLHEEDSKKLTFLKQVQEQISANKIISDKNNNPYYIAVPVYNEIVYKILYPVYLGMYGYTGTAKDHIGLDQLTTSIALKLIADNYLEFTRLYLYTIVNRIGYYTTIDQYRNKYNYNTYFNIPRGIYYLSFLIIQWFFFIYLFFKTHNKYYVIFPIITFIHCLNYGLVALVEPVMLRYSFYTDTLQLAFQIIIFSRLWTTSIRWVKLNFISLVTNKISARILKKMIQR